MDPKNYWLISAPKTREDTFNTINNKTSSDDVQLSQNWKFPIPDLKVGTLDTLMALSDELHKVDTMVENSTRKIATQLQDLFVTDSNTKASEKPEPLTVNNNNVDAYLTFFRWEEAKYPSSQPLKNLVETIQSQVIKLDEELKTKSSEYNNVVHALNAEDRKMGGNLLVRDLSDLVQKKHVVENSEFMESIFLCVPKTSQKVFLAGYERLAKYIVPRSADLVTEDMEYCLYKIVLFKQCFDEFKTNCREQKYIIRDFKFDPNHSVKEDKKKMEMEKDKLKKNLIRWCKTNFSEAFVAWIHLKAIRVFVESVLRYGLPTNFQAVLMLPQKNKVKNLRKVLHDLFGHLASKSVFGGGKAEHEEDDDKFFPYVFLEINYDYRKTNL